MALWADRLNPEPPRVTKASEAWARARAAVPGAAPIERFDPFRYFEKTYSSYLNCTEDAFATAARTLAARIDQLGASNPAVAEWLRAQDQVFGNCSTPATIPEAPSPTLLPIMRADRQYQIASALFYAGRFEAAEQAFGAVAADRDSPWRPLGRYLQARALIRRGTVDGDRASLARAEALLGQVATDPGEATLQPAARRLLAFVRASTAPVARVQELGAALSKPGAGTDVEQALWDYTVLLDTLEASPAEARARAATIGAVPQYPTLQAMRDGAGYRPTRSSPSRDTPATRPRTASNVGGRHHRRRGW